VDAGEEERPGSKRETILTIANRHYECCGVPPKLDLDKGPTAYFENRYGEQVILQYDNKQKVCWMWHGDVGWEEPLKVVEFRGRPLVLFVRSRKEREAEFKMNKQLDLGDLLKTTEAEKQELRQPQNAVLRRIFGKPRLTDEECELVSDGPILSEQERNVIAGLWNIWTR
jgi:hypothetical protein